MAVEEILADYEDLEREDILAALDFARQLSQIKRIEPIVAWSFSLMLNFHDVSLTSYVRQDLKRSHA